MHIRDKLAHLPYKIFSAHSPRHTQVHKFWSLPSTGKYKSQRKGGISIHQNKKKK